MSLDYQLKMEVASIEGTTRDAILASSPGLKLDLDAAPTVKFAAYNQDLYITARLARDLFQDVGGCSFHSASVVSYRIRDKFEYPRAICSMVKSVDHVLRYVTTDAILLFNGDVPLLVRCLGELKISRSAKGERNFWDVDGRKELLTHKYEREILKL